jgi:hypothetical protein
MTERDKLIEAMARAHQAGALMPWELLANATKSRIKIEMARLLSAIEAHADGCRVVPLQRTNEMRRWNAWADMLRVSPYAPPSEGQ